MLRIFTIITVLTIATIPHTLGRAVDGNSGGYRYIAEASTMGFPEMPRKASCFTRTWDGFNGTGTRDCL